MQNEVDTVDNWLTEYKMPLSNEKSLVMHYRSHQPVYEYSLNDCKLKCMDSLLNLGVKRSLDNGYSGHCPASDQGC